MAAALLVVLAIASNPFEADPLVQTAPADTEVLSGTSVTIRWRTSSALALGQRLKVYLTSAENARVRAQLVPPRSPSPPPAPPRTPSCYSTRYGLNVRQDLIVSRTARLATHNARPPKPFPGFLAHPPASLIADSSPQFGWLRHAVTPWNQPPPPPSLSSTSDSESIASPHQSRRFLPGRCCTLSRTGATPTGSSSTRTLIVQRASSRGKSRRTP